MAKQGSEHVKLSPRMMEALENLKVNGKFQLEELSDWDFWRPAKQFNRKTYKNGYYESS